MKKENLKKYILDLFYPSRCACCGNFIKWNESICNECEKKLLETDIEICPACGKKLEDCICSLGMSYDRCIGVTTYNEISKQGIFSMKNSVGKGFADWSGKILAKKIMNDKKISQAEIIIPVPMRAKKEKIRGYNQAELIARSISQNTGIPLEDGILKKNPHGRDKVQHMLNAEQRAENAEKMYSLTNRKLEAKNIIICDDVLTTGSTLDKCARLLKSAGAEFVSVAVCAITSGKEEK